MAPNDTITGTARALKDRKEEESKSNSFFFSAFISQVAFSATLVASGTR